VPTQIHANGFFSDEAEAIHAQIKTENRQLFFYLAEVNEQAHKYLAKLRVNSQDLKKLLTAAFLARVMTAYQALIFLAERGFASEAKAICRNILEAKFKLGFLFEEPEAANMMLAKHEAERIKRFEKYKAKKLPVHKNAGDPDWQKLIDAAKARQKKLIGNKGSLPHMSKIAEIAGFSKDYFGAYSLFSDATHSGVGELEIYLQFNEDYSAATDFVYGPSNGPWIPWCTLITSGYLLESVEITALLVEIRKERWFENWLKTRCKRHKDILELYRDRLSADFRASKR
jgi:hypothetical protein